VAVIPLLHQARGAEFELAEHAGAITAAGEQRAVVKAFVVFDAYEELAGFGFALDLGGVAHGEHQGLDGDDVLVGAEGGHDDVEVELIGHGGDEELARRHGGDGLTVASGVGIGDGAEGVAGEGVADSFVRGEGFQRGGALGADSDLAGLAEALELVEGR
jgi:hypothetical protein